MKRMTRDRRLTVEEAAKYKAVRDQVAAELPELVARLHKRAATRGQSEASDGKSSSEVKDAAEIEASSDSCRPVVR